MLQHFNFVAGRVPVWPRIFGSKKTRKFFKLAMVDRLMNFVRLKQSLVLLSVCCCIGCGSADQRNADFVAASNNQNIKKVTSLYQLYATRTDYTGPKSKEELIEFVNSNQSIAENLELLGIDREKINEYFISENDGQEFDVRWEVWINPDSERTKEPLVFEREGKDGVRLVMLSNRNILEVEDDAKYQKLLKGKVSQEDGKSELEKAEAEEAAAL